MIKKYSNEILMVFMCLLLCASSFLFVKHLFFSNKSIMEPLEEIIKDNKKDDKNKYKEAVTVKSEDGKSVYNIKLNSDDDSIQIIEENIEKGEYPYANPPEFNDDGSIIYDGMTLTELTDKLNKSLNGYMVNTGYFFADYTRRTGLDPYLALAIVLYETGCKWTCSSLTRNCNNIGGLKGSPSCNGGSYRKYNTLGEGIDGYLDIIYNNYYLKGMKTANQMAHVYAGNPSWADNVNSYIREIKAK